MSKKEKNQAAALQHDCSPEMLAKIAAKQKAGAKSGRQSLIISLICSVFLAVVISTLVTFVDEPAEGKNLWKLLFTLQASCLFFVASVFGLYKGIKGLAAKSRVLAIIGLTLSGLCMLGYVGANVAATMQAADYLNIEEAHIRSVEANAPKAEDTHPVETEAPESAEEYDYGDDFLNDGEPTNEQVATAVQEPVTEG